MALKQKRRSISFSKAIHQLAMEASKRAGKTASHWLTELICAELAAQGIAIPEQQHVTLQHVERVARGKERAKEKKNQGATICESKSVSNTTRTTPPASSISKRVDAGISNGAASNVKPVGPSRAGEPDLKKRPSSTARSSSTKSGDIVRSAEGKSAEPTIAAGFCATCLSARGPFVLRPFGQNDAFVKVCEACDEPKTGRYASAGSRHL